MSPMFREVVKKLIEERESNYEDSKQTENFTLFSKKIEMSKKGIL